jgi:hypothetical protein
MEEINGGKSHRGNPSHGFGFKHLNLISKKLLLITLTQYQLQLTEFFCLAPARYSTNECLYSIQLILRNVENIHYSLFLMFLCHFIPHCCHLILINLFVVNICLSGNVED